MYWRLQLCSALYQQQGYTCFWRRNVTLSMFSSDYTAGTQVTRELLMPVEVDATITEMGEATDISKRYVTEDEYIEMIRLKTAVLLAASLKIGAILAGATAEDSENLYHFGMHIGVAFQLQDDLLDVYGDPEVFGKKIGGDILCNKKTYMLIKALEHADEKQQEELNRWLNAENFSTSRKNRSGN